MNDKEYPAIPVNEKYDRAIKNVKDEKARKYIMDLKGSLLKNKQPLPSSKMDRVKRIIKHLFKP